MSLLRLGISSCLRGEYVRWDGGHKRERSLDEIADDVEWVMLCPEVEVGMGTPRPTVRLVDDCRMVEPKSGRDYTEEMNSWSATAVAGLPELDGYILKKGSPSCGPDRVKRYVDGMPNADATGLFAAALTAARPWMPVIDEGRLREPVQRENFFAHAVWMRRWREAGGLEMPTARLLDFHRVHKITYMAKDPGAAKLLGQLAGGDTVAYRDAASNIMATIGSRGRIANALQHMAGFLKEFPADDRQELAETIQGYQSGVEPLLVPLTLIRHYVRRGAPEWLADQVFLNPYPSEWRLRFGL